MPLVSTSPTRSEAQAASWEAIASRRDHAAHTIRKAYASSRFMRLISKAASTWRENERCRELRDSSTGQGDEEYITSSELDRWLKRAAQHNMSEIVGMTLNREGEAILRDVVKRYKRAHAAGATVALLAEADDELNYLMGRLRRHLVRGTGGDETEGTGIRGAGEGNSPPVKPPDAPTAKARGDDGGHTEEGSAFVIVVAGEMLKLRKNGLPILGKVKRHLENDCIEIECHDYPEWGSCCCVRTSNTRILTGLELEDAMQVERALKESLGSPSSERTGAARLVPAGHTARGTSETMPDATAAKTRVDDKACAAATITRDAPREEMVLVHNLETGDLWEVSHADYARCVSVGAVRPADEAGPVATAEQRGLDEAYVLERAAARSHRATKRAAVRASKAARSVARTAAIAAKIASGACLTSDDELPDLASATESDSSADSEANMREREARIRLMRWGTDHAHAAKPEQQGSPGASAYQEHSVEAPRHAVTNSAPDHEAERVNEATSTRGPGEPTGSVSSGSDCTLDTFPTGFERERMRAAHRRPQRTTAERASAYVYATSPSGSVCTGKGVELKDTRAEPPQCPERGIGQKPPDPHSDSDQPSDTTGSQDTADARARCTNLGWAQFYEEVRALDNRQSERPLPRPHYIGGYRSVVPYGTNSGVDATTDRVDSAIETLNGLLEQLADL